MQWLYVKTQIAGGNFKGCCKWQKLAFRQCRRRETAYVITYERTRDRKRGT